MRTRLAMLVAAVGLVALFTASGAPARTSGGPPHYALVPNAVAFVDRLHGVLGIGLESCANTTFHCRLQGTISATSDGGQVWHVLRRTPSPVVAVAFFHDLYYATLADGETLSGKGRDWRRQGPLSFRGYCPKGWSRGISADLVDTNIEKPWSVCSGVPGAGNVEKAVYRGTKRVALTPNTTRGGSGGISHYGYPIGIAGAGAASESSGSRAARCTSPATAATAGTPYRRSPSRNWTSGTGRTSAPSRREDSCCSRDQLAAANRGG